jgi:hypothetical protein
MQAKGNKLAKAFFRYLSKTHLDTRYQAFELWLELPKALKERKHVTSRAITKGDIENLLAAIKRAYRNGEISGPFKHQYAVSLPEV